MAVSHFAAPISDEDETILRSGAVPQKTQSTTDWGIRVWKEWAAERNPQSADGRCPLSSSFLMSVDDFSYWLASSSLKSERRTARSTHQKLSTCLYVASSVFLKRIIGLM